MRARNPSPGGGCALIKPVVERRVQKLCTLPYPDHPHGCTNYGRKAGCPPHDRTLWDVLDADRPVMVVWNDFNLAAHANRMRRKHPDWSDRQARCCLYWQPRARRQLKDQIAACCRDRSQPMNLATGLKITMCPEAMGVNITATMQQCGVTLEWPPRVWAYQVALVGTGLHDKEAREEVGNSE